MRQGLTSNTYVHSLTANAHGWPRVMYTSVAIRYYSSRLEMSKISSLLKFHINKEKRNELSEVCANVLYILLPLDTFYLI